MSQNLLRFVRKWEARSASGAEAAYKLGKIVLTPLLAPTCGE